MKAHTQSPTDEWLKYMFDAGITFLVTDKFDGIRCVNRDEGACSRTLKLIPNVHVRRYLEEHVPIGFDGELMTAGVFGDCQSHFMSRDIVGDFTFHVFDDVTVAHQTYLERVDRLQRFFEHVSIPHVTFERPRLVMDFATLQVEEQAAIDRGREGLILRVPWGPYKYGRSTLNEAYMLKLKRWEDAEATIVGGVPLMRNANTPIINVFGRQERGHGVKNKYPDKMLGAFIVFSEKFGTFNIGGPFTELQRCKFGEDLDNLIGKQITFKFQLHGTQSKPRSPKFHRIRMD